jgi:hypothetical protein
LIAQTLARIERGHAQDLEDVAAMLDRGLVAAVDVRRGFERIVDELHRFPAVDPASFRARLEAALAGR